jgi:hypothetical protein
METLANRMIEITTTLERIDQMNKAIEFHSGQPQKDELAILQYIQLRKSMVDQLAALLAAFNIAVTMRNEAA